MDEDEYLHSLKSLPNQTWDMGTSRAGVQSLVHFEDGEVITEKWYDAEPLADDCHESRVASQGDSWGEGKVVGTIPLVDLIPMIESGDYFDQRKVVEYFKAHPQFVRFEKILK